jgi:hypothetical protein
VWSAIFGDGAPQQVVAGAAAPGTGELVVTGRFEGEVDFGDGALTWSVGEHAWLAAFDDAGAVRWSRDVGDLFLWDVEVDAAGDILLGGLVFEDHDFGGGPVPAAATSVFARFDRDGNHLASGGWAGLIGLAQLAPTHVGFDPAGNLVIAGPFTDTYDFGVGSVATAGGFDVFVIALDPSGAPLWVTSFGGVENEYVRALEVDAEGSVFVAGDTPGDFAFAGETFGGGPGPNLFLVKLDATGAPAFGHGFATAVDPHMGLAPDEAGGVFVAGGFAYALDLGGGPLPNGGGDDLFAARFDGTGALHWARADGDVMDQAAHAATLAASGDLVITGLTAGTVDYGAGPLTAAGDDILLLGLDPAGDHVFSAVLGDDADQAGLVVAPDPRGGVLLGANVEGAVDFGDGPLIAEGSTDVVLAHLDPG